MRRAPAFAAGLISVVCLAAPAQAAQISVVVYQCNLNGVPGQLTAQVEAINSAGVWMDSGGRFAGSVATGDVNYYYQGTLVSQTGRYSFTGTNGFADFVDLSSNTRFRVQMVPQGNILALIIEGPAREQYVCQMVGRQ
jgi:hypothetical protein